MGLFWKKFTVYFVQLSTRWYNAFCSLPGFFFCLLFLLMILLLRVSVSVTFMRILLNNKRCLDFRAFSNFLYFFTILQNNKKLLFTLLIGKSSLIKNISYPSISFQVSQLIVDVSVPHANPWPVSAWRLLVGVGEHAYIIKITIVAKIMMVDTTGPKTY